MFKLGRESLDPMDCNPQNAATPNRLLQALSTIALSIMSACGPIPTMSMEHGRLQGASQSETTDKIGLPICIGGDIEKYPQLSRQLIETAQAVFDQCAVVLEIGNQRNCIKIRFFDGVLPPELIKRLAQRHDAKSIGGVTDSIGGSRVVLFMPVIQSFVEKYKNASYDPTIALAHEIMHCAGAVHVNEPFNIMAESGQTGAMTPEQCSALVYRALNLN